MVRLPTGDQEGDAVRHLTSLRWHYPVQVRRVFLSPFFGRKGTPSHLIQHITIIVNEYTERIMPAVKVVNRLLNGRASVRWLKDLPHHKPLSLTTRRHSGWRVQPGYRTIIIHPFACNQKHQPICLALPASGAMINCRAFTPSRTIKGSAQLWLY